MDLNHCAYGQDGSTTKQSSIIENNGSKSNSSASKLPPTQHESFTTPLNSALAENASATAHGLPVESGCNHQTVTASSLLSSSLEHVDNAQTKTNTASSSAPRKPTSTTAASALIISAADKAGMEGIDRERINAILLRESGNSPFMQRQRKMDDNTNRKVSEMKRRLEEQDNNNNSTHDWKQDLKRSIIDPLLDKYQSQRHPISTCVVIDMDGFFISCHILHHPHLATVPACVGGQSMISTSNYVARKYGVRAAMPGYIGSTLVRELSGGKESLTFVKSDFELYKQKSEQVRKVLEEYDPYLKMYSLDEAYIDLGPYLDIQLKNQGKLSHGAILQKLLSNENENDCSSKPPPPHNDNNELSELFPHCIIHKAAQTLLHSIRQRVKHITGLTCSAGMASNFLLAKIASDIHKPNGQYFVGPSEQEIRDFVNPLPVRKVNGIGRVMEKILRDACGVETVRDLYYQRAEAYFLFKQATANFLMRACIGYASWGKDRLSPEEQESGGGQPSNNVGDAEESVHRKGISHERTFSPSSSWIDLCSKLETITLCLVRDLKERDLKPRTVTLKVKLANFEVLSRATTRDAAFFKHDNNTRQDSQYLVEMVIRMLREAKRAYDIGSKNGGTSKNGPSGNRSAKAGSTGGGPFSVRLLGVRCSNFLLEKDNQSSLDRFCNTKNSLRKNKPREIICNPAQAIISTKEHNKSPIKTNPYLSPKPAVSTEKSPVGVKNNISSSTTSRRSLYKNNTSPNGSFPNFSTNSITDTATRLITNNSNECIQCPICKKIFQSGKHHDKNVEINAHIDSCLNSSTVKQLAKEETVSADSREERTKKKKRRRLTDFFSS